MKLKNIQQQLGALLSADQRAQSREKAAIKHLLAKLKKKERHLLAKLDELALERDSAVDLNSSYAQDLELSRIGIELKTVIDQFREQVQNIE